MSKAHQIGRREFLESGFAALGGATVLSPRSYAVGDGSSSVSSTTSAQPPAWSPQSYSVEPDDAEGKLTVSTRYYTVTHDLKKGGAITRIHYTYGKAGNLLLRPLAATLQVRGEEPPGEITGEEVRHNVFTDVFDAAPSVSTAKTGRWEFVTTKSKLLNHDGEDSGITTSTSYTYRWGYVKIHKEFHFPSQGVKFRRLSVISTLLEPSLSDYGYHPNAAEAFSPEVLQNGSCLWGKIRAGRDFDIPFETRYIPRYLVCANAGVEAIEWFASDALWQWDYQVAGQQGAGYAGLHASVDPAGVEISIDPLNLAPTFNLEHGGYVRATGSYSFDYYLGIPILDGHAQNPWFERSFGARRGKWVPEDEIKHNAELGVATMTLHNDGDENSDGLYWRDGTWPPYPPDQMKKMAEVVENCHQYGIKTVPYFSNHELHQATQEFRMQGEEWGRKPDDQGNLRPNFDWGALMCLKSGWLDYFKLCVDRALRNYPFDGVYYDWNQPLYCNNALHVGKATNGVSPANGLGSYALSPTGHWDVDELLELMEWTRERVGPNGLILVHNSMNPMLAVENFANAVCTMEWGYGQLCSAMPRPADLPLEWNMAGARSRAVIEYGTIAEKASPHLRRLFHLTALLTGVATWPASDGALKLFKLLKPLGNLEQYRFEDWRTQAVSLSHRDCYSAVYSRQNEAWVVLANLGTAETKVNCVVRAKALSFALASVDAALVDGRATTLDPAALTDAGLEITLAAASACLIHLR